MSGSIFGKQFQISTWGESHGKALGVVVDGCPAGLSLCEEDIQSYLNRRKPGQNRYSTPRKEGDQVEILSGVFDGKTTGTPISLIVRNENQRSGDYSEIASYYRPGHADYTFDLKYGFRDYRGGGRSSGRETIGRVAAGAIACKLLKELGFTFTCYTRSIGPIEISDARFDLSAMAENPLNMPDAQAAAQAAEYLDQCRREGDSSGGVVECVVSGMIPGLGDPVFEKLSANLAKAMFSIGAVKSFELGDGISASRAKGSANNDAFRTGAGGSIQKNTNHAGGTLGGISDGSDLVFRVGFKPTPSISIPQNTVNKNHEEISVSIRGRHDPVIVPRAVVVVEAMAALTLTDSLFAGMTSRMDTIQRALGRKTDLP